MFASEILLKTIFITVFATWTVTGSSEDYTRELVEAVFRIPNPDKVLNSVLGRLEKSRQVALARERSEDDCEDMYEGLPEYTESMVMARDRGMRHLDLLERPPKFYPICHLERKIRRLNTIEYEYRPAYYEEIRCASPKAEQALSNEICSSLGFSCVQWNKTLHLTRRRYNSDCWETQTMVVPAGCECMWPFHRLGDMNLHV